MGGGGGADVDRGCGTKMYMLVQWVRKRKVHKYTGVQVGEEQIKYLK